MNKIALFVILMILTLPVQSVWGQSAATPGQETCNACHEGLDSALPQNHPGTDDADAATMARIKAIFGLVKTSAFLDGTHNRQGTTCQACHGEVAPELGAEIENETCLTCHGSWEELAATTDNPALPDRNPHKSHLGEIGCTVCHHVHSASKSYCLECHKNFQMPIPGGGK